MITRHSLRKASKDNGDNLRSQANVSDKKVSSGCKSKTSSLLKDEKAKKVVDNILFPKKDAKIERKSALKAKLIIQQVLKTSSLSGGDKNVQVDNASFRATSKAKNSLSGDEKKNQGDDTLFPKGAKKNIRKAALKGRIFIQDVLKSSPLSSCDRKEQINNSTGSSKKSIKTNKKKIVPSKPKLKNEHKSDVLTDLTRCSQRLKSKVKDPEETQYNVLQKRKRICALEERVGLKSYPSTSSLLKDGKNMKENNKSLLSKESMEKKSGVDANRSNRLSTKKCPNKVLTETNSQVLSEKENLNMNNSLKKPVFVQRNKKNVSKKCEEIFGTLSVKKTSKKLNSPRNNKLNSGTKKGRSYRKSDSFERYGIILPTSEEILNAEEKLKKEDEFFEEYEAKFGKLFDSFTSNLLNINNNKKVCEDQNLLGCDHLSEETLEVYFKNNLEYLQDIYDGKQKSERHEKFLNYDPRWDFTMQDLTYRPSVLVFSDKQRDLLFKMLVDHFDTDKEHTEYLLKVLLPELCLKIFMDVHDMTADTAEDYLEWRPVE